MIQYPLQFNVSSAVSPGIAAPWRSAAGEFPALTLAIPPEFDGPGGGFSPEDLFGLALLNCFAGTFKVVAEKSSLAYAHLQMHGTLTVDRDEKGRPWMKAFAFDLRLEGVTDGDRARRLLEKTSQTCLILNSVKTEITFRFDVA